MIDLDHFKSINDRFGHALGDRVLEIFAESARQSVRSSDLLGRLGGEEFAAVLSDTSRDKAAGVAERIRESFAQATQEVDNRPIYATVSIGLVHCQDAALDVAALLAQADQALYIAKERGRNRVEVASLDMMRKRADEDSTASATSAGQRHRGLVPFHFLFEDDPAVRQNDAATLASVLRLDALDARQPPTNATEIADCRPHHGGRLIQVNAG